MNPRAIRTFWCLLLTALGLLIEPVMGQPIENPQTLENSLAKAYLYIISRSSWPEPVTTKLTFCINRSHSLYDTFTKVIPATRLERYTLEIKLIDEDDDVGQRNCQIIALHKNPDFIEKVSRRVMDLPILTISHEADITEANGIIFISFGKRLEPPKINFDTLGASGLRIDASILDLSKRHWHK